MTQETVASAPQIPAVESGEIKSGESESLQPASKEETSQVDVQPEGDIEQPAEGEQAEDNAPQTTPWNPEAYKDDLAFKEHQDEFKRVAFREGHIAGQKRESGQRNQTVNATQAIQRGLGEVNGWLRQLHESGQGIDPVTFDQLMEKHGLNNIPKILAEDTIQVAQRATGAVSTAVTLAQIAQRAEDPKLLEIAGRLVEPTGKTDSEGNPVYRPSAEFEYDNGREAVEDFMKALLKSVSTKAEDKGYKRGLADRTTASVEAGKVVSREGKGPSTVSGSAGKGSKSFSSLQEAQLAHARDEITNNDMRRIRSQFLEAERNK